MNRIQSMTSSIITTSPCMPWIPGSGVVRWNQSIQSFEVMGNGNEWYRLEFGTASVGLSHDTETVITWAKGKMAEETRIKELLASYPGLKELKDQYDMMLTLVNQESNTEKKI